jgi:4-hydroxy-tetrahydrodipicolinate reductase
MVVGARGRVGEHVVAGVEEASDLVLAGAVDVGENLKEQIAEQRPEVAVDFTVPDAVSHNVSTLLRAGVNVIVGTTGITREELDAIDAIAREHQVGCLVAPNFALGAVLMMRFAEEAARHYEWVEVIERHHEHKLDAPSGTARTTAERIAAVRKQVPEGAPETESAPGARGGRVNDVPVHSVRLPGSVAHQEVWFGGAGETLVIRHDTISRDVFVPGVLLGVRRIKGHVGLIHGLDEILWPDA